MRKHIFELLIEFKLQKLVGFWLNHIEILFDEAHYHDTLHQTRNHHANFVIDHVAPTWWVVRELIALATPQPIAILGYIDNVTVDRCVLNRVLLQKAHECPQGIVADIAFACI